jgi:hypothetical protein
MASGENGQKRMKSTGSCCARFAEVIKLNEILHSEDHDETEWYFDGLWHIYYCPFCRSNIKDRVGVNPEQKVTRYER